MNTDLKVLDGHLLQSHFIHESEAQTCVHSWPIRIFKSFYPHPQVFFYHLPSLPFPEALSPTVPQPAGSYIAQNGSKFEIFLPQPPEHWDCRHVALHMAHTLL